MTTEEVSEQTGLSQDSLKYYKRVGIIPEVTRTAGRIRDYQEEDMKWVQLRLLHFFKLFAILKTKIILYIQAYIRICYDFRLFILHQTLFNAFYVKNHCKHISENAVKCTRKRVRRFVFEWTWRGNRRTPYLNNKFNL